VFTQQFHGGTIRLRVGLCQVHHGSHEQALSFNVARIAAALSIHAVKLWPRRNDDNFAHSIHHLLGRVQPEDCCFILWARVCLLIRRYNLWVRLRLQRKYIITKRRIYLDI